jgi:hypothetical protein
VYTKTARPSTQNASGTANRSSSAPNPIPTNRTAATPSEKPPTRTRPTATPTAMTTNRSRTGFVARVSEIDAIIERPPAAGSVPAGARTRHAALEL